MAEASQNILILGIGNVALSDEGFGVRVAQRMQAVKLPDNIRVQEGAVAGFDLLGSFTDVDRVIVVDAMMADLPPGEIAFFDLDDRINAAGKTNLSFHQVGITELLQISALLGQKPQVQFLVASPLTLELGFALSPEVQKAVDKAVSFLTEILAGDTTVTRQVTC